MTDITVNYPLLPLLPPSGSYTRNSAYSTSGYNFTSTRSLPPTLWRIYNDTSVSRRLPNGGFLAGSPDKAINMNDPQGVAIEIKLHLNWYSPLKTVFISSSQNFSWIQYHAVKRELKGRKNVRVSQINTAFALECGAKIFHMVALAEFSGRKIPQRAEKSAQDEWVFLTEIPSWAVVADYTAREFAALRSPLIGTQQGWGLLPTPESQYPTLSGWGSSPYVSQSFNMGYAPSWRNMNINPALWYYGNNLTWQSPSGNSNCPPITTSPDRNGSDNNKGGLVYTAVDDQEPLNFLPALNPEACSFVPTTVSAGSYIDYPTLPESPSNSKIATTDNLVRAAAAEYWESIYGHDDYCDNYSETANGTGDERYEDGDSVYNESYYENFEGVDSEREESDYEESVWTDYLEEILEGSY